MNKLQETRFITPPFLSPPIKRGKREGSSPPPPPRHSRTPNSRGWLRAKLHSNQIIIDILIYFWAKNKFPSSVAVIAAGVTHQLLRNLTPASCSIQTLSSIGGNITCVSAQDTSSTGFRCRPWS